MVVIFGLFKLFSGSVFGIYKLRLRKVRGVWSSKLGSYISHCFFATDKVLEKVVIWGVAFSTHSHRNSTVSARIFPLFYLPNFKELVPLPPPISIIESCYQSYASAIRAIKLVLLHS